jgi:hypothetical protein
MLKAREAARLTRIQPSTAWQPTERWRQVAQTIISSMGSTGAG